jgi:spore photoproduct lyase
MKFRIDEVWIDDEAEGYPQTDRILGRLDGAKIVFGERVRDRNRAIALSKDPFEPGKRILRLMKHKGAFVKPCPGTPEYLCCGLEILHIGQGCPMDCRYCALQVYFNRPVLEVFVNVEDMLEGLTGHLESNLAQFHRICTGEFTDSLALDPLTNLGSMLVERFASTNRASLEIKTKTDFIDPLLKIDPGNRVILAFSVNASEISRREEIRAVSIERRLDAARRAAEHGYRVAFHFDPIIPTPGWQAAYGRTVDRIFESVDGDKIAWISMGVLRFIPDLKETVAARFGRIPYFHDGFIRGLDGKFRLEAHRRISIYKFLAEKIRSLYPPARLYLCMESQYVWQEALGMDMPSDEALAAYLSGAFD